MKVAFIGLGNMGSGMARRLLESGFELVVYNRTAEKAKELVAAGAILAKTPGEAVASADVLITMVNDDQALEAVLRGENGALNRLAPGSTHLSMSTISDALAERLAGEHLERQVAFVGAPVFGRPPAAAAGKLFVMAGGDEKSIQRCDDIFKALAQKVVVVGPRASQAHLAKVMGNFMLFSAIEALAESIANVRAAGMSERMFLDAMTSTIFSSPFYANYGNMMVEQSYPTQQAVSFHLALKDVRLALDSSARNRAVLPTAELLESRLLAGIAGDLGDLDVSALTKLASSEGSKTSPKEKK